MDSSASYSQMNQTKLPDIHQHKLTTTSVPSNKNILTISTQAFDLNLFNKALQKYN